jgi:hypothetical protein
VVVFPDHLEVRVAGAPPLNVTLAEVGIREGGTERSVSENRGNQSETTGEYLIGRHRQPTCKNLAAEARWWLEPW